MGRLTTLVLVLCFVPLTACAAYAEASNSAFETFFAQTFPLTKSEFRSIQGSPVANTQTNFIANISVDSKVFTSCEVVKALGVFLSCSLQQYTGNRWLDAVSAIRAALPEEFRSYYLVAKPGIRHIVWVRRSDTMTVDLVENITTQPLNIWIQQSLKITNSPESLDAGSAPVPIFPDAMASQVLRLGLVVANDSRYSYVLAVSNQRPAESVYIGNPLAPGGWWRVVPAKVVAYDGASGLTLLSASRLAIRPQPLEIDATQGEPIELLRYSFCTYQQMVDAVSCTLDVDTGIISAVHPQTGEFEHSTMNQVFDADGAPIVDSKHNVVGIALGPDLRNGSGSSIGIGAAQISRFIKVSAPGAINVRTEAYEPADPDSPVVKRVKQSVVGIHVLDSSSGRAQQRDGTGIVVRREAGGALVLSAAHVIPTPEPDGGYRITVVGDGKPPLAATIRKVDWKHDLVELFVQGLYSIPLVIAHVSVPGERVASLGFGHSSSRSYAGDGPELVKGTTGAVDRVAGFVDYDLATSQGFSGGPIFDLNSGVLVGIVHGEIDKGVGGYEGVGASEISRFLGQIPSSPSLNVVDSPAVMRVARSLVLVDCTLPDSKHVLRTGVVVASDVRASYVVTASVPSCQPKVYIAGDRDKVFRARVVANDAISELNSGTFIQAQDTLSILAINEGRLPASSLGSASSAGSQAYVLSYADSARAQFEKSEVVPPRVDETRISNNSPFFESNNGVGLGGAIFDSSYNHLLGIVTFNGEMQSLGSVDAHGYPLPPPPPDTRVRYTLAKAAEIDNRLQFSVDDIPYKRIDPLPDELPYGAVMAIMQKGRIPSFPESYIGFANAVPIGTRNGRSYFVSILTSSDRDNLALAFTDDSGATKSLEMRVLASDTSSSLALLSTAEIQEPSVHWSYSKRNAGKAFVPYYSFCQWDTQRAAALHLDPYELPACRYHSYWGTLSPGSNPDSLVVGKLGIVLGRTCQGAPIIDSKTLGIDGLASDCTTGYDALRVAAFLRTQGWTLAGR